VTESRTLYVTNLFKRTRQPRKMTRAN